MTPSAGSATRRSCAVAAVALLAATATLAGPAEAAPATCGLTITSDYTLHANLRCSGTAITVQVDDPAQPITLDLGGHSVVGDGTGSAVYVNAEMSGTVVIRNGQIRTFDAGVAGSGVLHLTLEDVTLRQNGVWLAPSFLEVLTLTITRSRVVDSGVSGAYTESTTTVRESEFVRSGISSPGETYTNVYDSTFVGGGVTTGQASNVVAERNTFRRCDIGIDAGDSWPWSVTTVRDNRFVDCRVGMRLEVSAAGTGANGVTIANNEFLRNAQEGLLFGVLDPFGEISITGNRAVGNGGTGIAGTGSGVVTVAGNTALRNGGHGIDVSEVIDGGGNVARGNATPPQCIGVVCSTREMGAPGR